MSQSEETEDAGDYKPTRGDRIGAALVTLLFAVSALANTVNSSSSGSTMTETIGALMGFSVACFGLYKLLLKAAKVIH